MRKRAKFNMSHINSTTLKMGYIVPIMLNECLPGDTWQGDNKLFTRVAPLAAPVMHKVQQQVFTFFVPNRLLWDNWEDFITGGQNGTDTSVPPTVSITPTVGSLADYFGLPLTSSAITVSALPFRAMALIWNDFFRDQNLQDEIEFSTDDGPDTVTPTTLLKANWAKDYFTTARVSPQVGDAVSVPIMLTGEGESPLITAVTNTTLSGGGVSFTGSSVVSEGTSLRGVTTSNGSIFAVNGNGSNIGSGISASYSRPTASSVTSITWNGGPETEGFLSINALREGQALQRWQEKRNLFGSRYEDLLHFWGLSTQDFRLQRPELVSIRSSLLQFSEVLQTSPTAGSTDGVGSLYGHGVGAMRSGRWRYYCHEHGFLISFLVVRPQAVYTQGIERMWFRNTRYDYWNPEFQHIGQQAVLVKELYADGSDNDEEIFGYQNRYDEMRRGKNHVTGEFRTTLDYWNMARQFENAPNLNSEFITANPTDRIYQLSESLSDQLYVMVQNDLVAKRLISRNGNPI